VPEEISPEASTNSLLTFHFQEMVAVISKNQFLQQPQEPNLEL
jgi:hypothetical protein